MANPTDTGGNVRVDFVWGNLPMQPDDARGAHTLDPALDNHIVASTMYNGFPGNVHAYPYLDTVANVLVPTLTGLTQAAATTALTGVGLVLGTATTTYVGATTVNNGTVKTQSVAAGTSVNVGSSVDFQAYAAPLVPNLIGMTAAAATTALTNVGLVLGVVTGTTGVVSVQSIAAGTMVNAGTAVAITIA